ncbi:hypothetical protein ACFV8T_26925 [Streptomyces sp. NPDC059832]|uniref:hypothetical protein n=1 Tax=Streptomyces sp. NPDC059832 TaxID=3346966 RepID=UPI003660765D
MTARAITTRWYDHQQHLTSRWLNRLNHLVVANAHLDRAGSASAALLARDPVIYPETVMLARVLATLSPGAHHTTNKTVAGSPHRLGLDILAPATGEPLTAYLTHTRP